MYLFHVMVIVVLVHLVLFPLLNYALHVVLEQRVVLLLIAQFVLSFADWLVFRSVYFDIFSNFLHNQTRSASTSFYYIAFFL